MKHELEQHVAEACNSLFNVTLSVTLTRPDEQFGDYATNVALQLTKELGKSPRDIGEQLAEYLRTSLQEQVDTVIVAGPGFINLRLKDTALRQALIAKPAQALNGKTIVAEYSDPNPFKVLHAGHLYTTIAGDSITRILEAAGATVHRVNYGGDVGLHVGKAMWAILKELGGEFPDNLSSVEEEKRPDWVSARYVEGNTAYEEDKSAKNEIVEINKRVYELHKLKDHESPFAQIYWTCRQWSYDGFTELYKRLQVHDFERYIAESEVTPEGLALVEKGLNDGIFQRSDGAIVFDGESKGLHTRVFLNSEGLPTYEAKELGLAAMKWQEYHFDQSIIITANDIVEYMKVVLLALNNFYPEMVERSRHFTHGYIKLFGGEKMSSRTGNIVRALDILDIAEAANFALIGQENHDTVLAAIKYGLLKNRLGGDIIYDPEQSVALEGNSGPYLQYAHARACSIIRKSGIEPEAIESTPADTSFQSSERSLIRKITEYVEVFDEVVSELAPHHICNYLYELSQEFNRFYEQSKVVGDPREAIRLTLVQLYADTLRAGLDLLGVVAPDRM